MPAAIPRITVIGLGSMGSPMTERLAQSFPVTAYDVNPQQLAELSTQVAQDAHTPAEAAREADLVLLAVRDQQHVHDALFGPNGVVRTAAPGTSVLLTSTVGPEVARNTAQQLATHGIDLVDAPVSGGPTRAASGELLIVVGAEHHALERTRPVLEHLAGTLTVIGDNPGDGQAMKAINQLLAGVHIAAAAEAIALARELGLNPAQVIDSLGDGAASSFMLHDRGKRMLEAYADPKGASVRSRLDIFVKDMGIVSELTHRAQVPAPTATAAQQLYLLGEQSGLGAADDSSIVTLLSPRDDSAQPNQTHQ